jgi:hypothetical protein
MTEDHPAEAEIEIRLYCYCKFSGGHGTHSCKSCPVCRPIFRLQLSLFSIFTPSIKVFTASIASRRTPLKVKQAEDGDRINFPVAYLYCTPGLSHCKLIRFNAWRSRKTESEKFCASVCRYLFESAAQVYQTG